MADLLRSGNTMLNMACPACNNPIFRNKRGETFCAICNREVVIIKDGMQHEDKTIEQRPDNIKNQEDMKYIKFNEALHLLKYVIFEKIEFITQQLKTETQLHIIENYTNIILNLLDILNRLSNFNQ